MTDGISDIGPAGSTPPMDWEAIARHMAGESTPEESARIEAMLDQRPGDRELVGALDRTASRIAREIPLDIDVEAALLRVKARRDSDERPPLRVHAGTLAHGRDTSRPRWQVPIPAMAAAALLAVGATTWFAIRGDTGLEKPKLSPRMLATGVGVRDSLQLPDGSRIVLGPLSSVTIAADYGDRTRAVEIRGDAWFEVVHDSARPFTVRAGSATILDVGTKFAVRSDTLEGVSVAVTEGSVSLRAMNTPAAQGVILQAGDNGLLDTGGQVVARRGTVTDDDVAWLRGRLVFREAPLSEVIASMHRWYGLELRVTDSSLANRHLTASFAGDSPDRVLDVLRLALGADIERRGDTAIVRPAKGRVRSR